MTEYTDDLTGGKIYTASDSYAGYPPSAGFDDDTALWWHSATSGANKWLAVDFGEPVAIQKLRIYPYANYVGSFELQGSNDGIAWVTVLSGNANSEVWFEFEFNNPTKYQIYRVFRAANNYCVIKEIEMMSLVALNYNASGNYITPQIPTKTLPAQVRLQTQATTPPNTSIKIEYGFGATTPTVWTEVTDIINISGEFLWLRYMLETTDTTVTPTLSAVWLEAPEAPQDILRITVNDFARFNNAEGQLKVSYDSALGTLVGIGGAVQSFDAYFTPLDLLREINPNDEETIKTVISNVTLNYDLISYLSASSTEQNTIKANALSAAIEYTDVTIVNP